MKTAIVTGGAGFIGSHLVDRLVQEGFHVVVLDNLATGSWDNLSQHTKDTVTCIEADVSESWPEGALPPKCELIFHLASPASPVHYRRLAVETLMVNSMGTKHALDAALRYGARFVLASTSEAYGDPAVSPQPESYWGHVNPVGPRSCYDESKRFAEALTMEYVRKYHLDARILRFFNCYGPRMQSEDGRVVPNFVRQALLGKPLTVYGSGQQTRSFCYVSDEVDGIWRAAVTDGLAGEVMNIGNPEERTILNFAEVVAEVAGIPLKVEPRPLPPDDPTNRCPDISKARQLLGWEPRVSLKDGLEETFRYFRSAEHR
ncbi:UDP-glucuronic acid decarboxylase family protein [Sulfobacillus harzensis]|uniref:SDR family oxidoreductase n=1 Tax=Sulfobacillus harzensis TaxID=2729629 RepID=A0A7Y0L040_9FIRM|nr:UDP-glucuronic acid decarboxylase family protein [Sulfobacillus harzensis]NMP20864.1 SDR family oxidoreductase [Sulfobacillus harzensis]